MTTTIVTKCLVCNGSGTAEYDKPVTDYERGGYIDSEYSECYECSGMGEVDILSLSSAQEFLLAINTAEKILEDATIEDKRLDEMYDYIKKARLCLSTYMQYYNYD